MTDTLDVVKVVRVPDSIIQALKLEAVKDRTTVQAIVEEALRKHIKEGKR